MNRWRTWIAIGLAGVTIAACTGGCGSSGDASQTVLNRGIVVYPETLDPQKSRSTQANHVLRDLNEGLLRYSAEGILVGAAAREWRVSADGLEHTFTLRDGLRWSDGEPLTAEHFAIGFRRLVDPAVGAPFAKTAEGIASAAAIIAGEAPIDALGVSAPDERTVVVRLERPVPQFLYLLAHPSMFPARPDPGVAGGRLDVSNGAYRVAGYEPGTSVRLVRNEHYWDAANTAIDAVTYHVVTDEIAEYNRYRAGQLHITSSVPTALFAEARETFGDELKLSDYLGVYYYGFNLTKPPFEGNPQLRQALSMAIDREQFVAQVTARGEPAAYSWVPPGTYNYEPPEFVWSSLTPGQREERARRLYAAAGYGPDNPLEIELRYNTGEGHRRFAVAIAAMWADVLGVETSLVNEEFQVLLANIRAREVTQVFRSSWTGDYNDAQAFLGIMVSGHSSNLPGYSNADYDELLRRAATQTDADARRRYLKEAERVLLNDHAVIPLYFYMSKHLVRPEVEGWQDNVLDYHYSQDLSLGEADQG